MSYGISANNGTYNNIDPQALGGNVFVRTISVAVGSGGTYDIAGVTNHTFLRIYYVNAGSHSVSLSTVSGVARITVTPVSAYVTGNTILAVFTTQTAEPSYGISTTNTAGERIVSTLYAVPKYMGKVTFNTTPNYSVSPIGGTHNVRYHQATTSLGSFTKRLVLWTLPDQTSDVWYFGTDYIDETVGSSTLELGVLVPKTGGSYVLPEALIFSLEGYFPSSDTYGLRIYNSSGALTFDSGSQHMKISAYIGSAYSDSQYTETNTIISQTTTAIQIPDYRLEQYIGVPNSSSSNYYSYRGAVKRMGSTLYSKRFLVFRSFEDLFINTSDELGSAANTVLLIDAAQLGATTSGGGTAPGGTPTYSITPSATSINEGSSVTFNVTALNVPTGTTLYWTLSSPADFATSSGSFVVSSEVGSFTVTPTSDSSTEGSETFTASVRTGSTSGTIVVTSAAVTINDTSTTPITYSITPGVSNINEGSSMTFTVGTTGVANGTTLYWTLSRPEDFATSSGSFTIQNNSGSFSVVPSNDATTEGSETFTASVRTGSTSGTIVATSTSVTINDTSNAAPSYTLANGFDISVTDIDTSGGYAEAQLLIYTDGTYVINGYNLGQLNSGSWITPNSASSAYTFYVRFTRTELTGATYGDASTSTGWLQISQIRSVLVYCVTQDTIPRTVRARYLVEFSVDGGTTVGGSGYISLGATAQSSGGIEQ